MKTPGAVAALACLCGLVLPFITRAFAGRGGTLAWLVDLAANWQWVYLAGLILFGSIAAWSDRRWGAILLAAPLPWLSAAQEAPSAGAATTTMTVATANVGGSPRAAQTLPPWLARETFGLVALVEVSPGLAQALQQVETLPHRYLAPRDDPFGLALLSRYPIAGARIARDGDGIPRLRATIVVDQQPISVTVVHPMPPIAVEYHRSRDRQLREAAEENHLAGAPGLLLGDFNATPWSSGLAGPTGVGFRRASSLRPSWPSPLRGLLGIPIDQVLVSRHWQVAGAGLGPAMGSDHLPVWARLRLRDIGGETTGQ